MARSTASETQFRVQTVYGLLCDAKSRSDIIQFSAENWQVSERQADNYIQKARELLDRDAELTRPSFLAEALGRLRNYEQQAARRGQMQVAINSVRLQAELVGLSS